MQPQAQTATLIASDFSGDFRSLLAQLGSPAGRLDSVVPSELAGDAPILDVAGLREFLRQYRERLLGPVELPAIHRAFGHASRREARELVAYDREISSEAMPTSFASASRRAGQLQLQRLRPLRDERMVQRYLAAVDGGTAQGWHTLAYGLTLAVYSLPLRQGLLGYAEETMRSFVRSGAVELRISQSESRELFEEAFGGVAATVEKLVAGASMVAT